VREEGGCAFHQPALAGPASGGYLRLPSAEARQVLRKARRERNSTPRSLRPFTNSMSSLMLLPRRPTFSTPRARRPLGPARVHRNGCSKSLSPSRSPPLPDGASHLLLAGAWSRPKAFRRPAAVGGRGKDSLHWILFVDRLHRGSLLPPLPGQSSPHIPRCLWCSARRLLGFAFSQAGDDGTHSPSGKRAGAPVPRRAPS
jgi:hypothetical protein